MARDERNSWTALIDRYVHAFAVLYRTRYHQAVSGHGVVQGLTPLELGILNLLDWDPEPSPKQLAELLHAPNSTITSGVNRLEDRGILRRVIHPEDRRSFRLVLTSRGEELARHRRAEKRQLFGDMYDALGDSESREEFLVLLETIRSRLTGEEDLPGSGDKV